MTNQHLVAALADIRQADLIHRAEQAHRAPRRRRLRAAMVRFLSEAGSCAGLAGGFGFVVVPGPPEAPAHQVPRSS